MPCAVMPSGMDAPRVWLRMGNCNHRKYIPMLIDLVQSGALDPMAILTQAEPLMGALDAYKAFDQRQPGWIKVELDLGIRERGA